MELSTEGIEKVICFAMRCCQLRTLELQLEEEHDERQKLVRDKREVERQMQAISEQKPVRDRGLCA